ncbi:hypothetical protein F0919_17160 [Taibaiella lutea]|uniref:Uncharacterized protein n=1 Tax=Taibaiella lutea TaxID=2608001 RepID=A0A5M6CF28_9BACT|nr:hypothetical protein [Taibaiella lutea]KAA5532512.1 hypothetical protein F0919_17160 [Taibaiella lutea]
MNKCKPRFIIFLLLLFISHLSNAKGNYNHYYEIINRAETEFVNHGNRECFKYYDSAFSIFDEPFVKDAYIAAEIACYLKDTMAMFHYFDICFKNGLPLSSIRSAPILRYINKTDFYPSICALYDKDKNIKKTDIAAQRTIWLFCYESDSIKLKIGRDSLIRQQWFKEENGFREYIFKQYLSKGLFPGERIIGIATDSMYEANLRYFHKKDLYGSIGFVTDDEYKQDYDLLSKYALSVFIHSKCSFWKYKEQLWQAVLNGYLQPKEYAILEVTSTLWNQHNENSWDDCNISKKDLYYYILPDELRKGVVSDQSIDIIEQNRQKIYLQSYKIDEAKKQLQQQTGIWFFYDFIDRPRK